MTIVLPEPDTTKVRAFKSKVLLVPILMSLLGCTDRPTSSGATADASRDDEMAAVWITFQAADADNDGSISQAELAEDTAAAFAALDADNDGFLTPEEAGTTDAALFARLDTDGDGRLSIVEVMSHKIADMRRLDANGDGSLTYQEVAAFRPDGGAR